VRALRSEPEKACVLSNKMGTGWRHHVGGVNLNCAILIGEPLSKQWQDITADVDIWGGFYAE